MPRSRTALARSASRVARSEARKKSAKKSSSKRSATRKPSGKNSSSRSTSRKSTRKSNAVDSTPGWLNRGKSNVDKSRPSKNGGGQKFVPEFFLSENEKAYIRINTTMEDLITSVARHTYPQKSKNGKRYFRSFTCTENPDTCAGCANGDNASVRWPIILADGRKLVYNIDGKSVRKSNVIKLWTPSINELDSLTAAIEDENNRRSRKGEDEIDVPDVILQVQRMGSGPQTSYRFSVYDEEEISDRVLKRFDKFEQEFGTLEDILTPLPFKEQARISGYSGGGDPGYSDDSEDEDDDDDDYDSDDADSEYEEYDDD